MEETRSEHRVWCRYHRQSPRDSHPGILVIEVSELAFLTYRGWAINRLAYRLRYRLGKVLYEPRVRPRLGGFSRSGPAATRVSRILDDQFSTNIDIVVRGVAKP